jgi:hypothetical protein
MSTIRIASAFTALAAAALLTGCMMFAKPPRNLDYSRTRTSEAGLYRATIRPQGDSIPKGKLQRWTLHLETTGGAPVESATSSNRPRQTGRPRDT